MQKWYKEQLLKGTYSWNSDMGVVLAPQSIELWLAN